MKKSYIITYYNYIKFKYIHKCLQNQNVLKLGYRPKSSLSLNVIKNTNNTKIFLKHNQ